MCITLHNSRGLLGVYSNHHYLVGLKEFSVKDNVVNPLFFDDKPYTFEEHEYGVRVIPKQGRQVVLNELCIYNGLNVVHTSIFHTIDGLGMHVYYIASRNGSTGQLSQKAPEYITPFKKLACYVLMDVCGVQLVGKDSVIVDSVVLPEPAIQHELIRTFVETDWECYASRFLEKYEKVYSSTKRSKG